MLGCTPLQLNSKEPRVSKENKKAVFHGCEKFFRPSYAANLISSWIPSLEGVQAKLESGARVADVGFGKGASTVLMTRSLPEITVLRLRLSRQSIEGARAIAASEGLEVRLNFGPRALRSLLSSFFRFGSYVFEYSEMNSMNDVIRPQMPVRRRPHGVLIPRCSF
jgi:tRNA G46 methylase TrmB